MRTALTVFAAVLAALTALTFALDGETGPADVVLNALAAAAAAMTVQFGRTEDGALRREGVLAGIAAVAILVVIVVLRVA